MLGLSIDFSDVERVMRNLGTAQDQMPYALSVALNTATEATRQYLIRQTWPSKIKQRNATFLAASLTTKESRATKHMLSTEIWDKLDRGHLKMHAIGGVRTPQRGRAHMAIPSSNIPRGPRGVPQRLRPGQLEQLGKSFRKGDVIFVRDKKGRPTLMYVLKTSTPIRKRVPFYEDFQRVMGQELLKAIPAAVERAMTTRRAR